MRAPSRQPWTVRRRVSENQYSNGRTERLSGGMGQRSGTTPVDTLRTTALSPRAANITPAQPTHIIPTSPPAYASPAWHSYWALGWIKAALADVSNESAPDRPVPALPLQALAGREGWKPAIRSDSFGMCDTVQLRSLAMTSTRKTSAVGSASTRADLIQEGRCAGGPPLPRFKRYGASTLTSISPRLPSKTISAGSRTLSVNVSQSY